MAENVNRQVVKRANPSGWWDHQKMYSLGSCWGIQIKVIMR